MPAPFRAPTILIVEDDTPISELIQISLKEDGYFFRRVTDGNACLSLVRGERPDLILMDVMMPGMDGFTTAAMLAGDESAKSIPVIVLTAKKDMRDAFLPSPNIVDFIEKPFDPVTLRARVKWALGKSS